MTPEERIQLDEAIRKIDELSRKFSGFLDLYQRIQMLDKMLLTKPLVLRNTKIIIEGTDGLKIGENDTDKISFYGADPVAQQPAPTASLTEITHTAPVTPDYAIQDLTQTTPYGFATKDEGNSVLKVIANLQVRVEELEDILRAVGLIE